MTINSNLQHEQLATVSEDQRIYESSEYDISFAYGISWTSPNTQIPQALKLLLCACPSKPSTVPATQWSDNAAFEPSSVQAWQTRRILASHPSTPAPVLETMAVDSPPDIRVRIAENPATHPDTLSRLAWADEFEVRRAVAENPNTPTWTVRFLSTDQNPDVRYSLADNPGIDQTVLHRLASDENPYVARRAMDTLRRLNQVDRRAAGLLSRFFAWLRRQFLGAR